MEAERMYTATQYAAFVKNVKTGCYELLKAETGDKDIRLSAKEEALHINKERGTFGYDPEDIVVKHRNVKIVETYSEWEEDKNDNSNFMVTFRSFDKEVVERLKKNLTENGIEYFYEEAYRGAIKGFEYSLRFCYEGFDDFEYTKNGRENAEMYIREMKAKQKEIMDAGKDTCDDTNIPDEDEILGDIGFIGLDGSGEYYNGWGVTDNYDADRPICLKIGRDFLIKKESA